MAIQDRVVPDKPAARRLIESLLDRSGVKHRELAAALFLSRGALARKLGVRYPDRFTEPELSTLVAFLELTTEQRDHLLRSYGYAETVPSSDGRASHERAHSAHPEPGHAPLPGVLPASLTSFIGRDWERATTRRLLATTRLLTLTGAGGIGKTRLALELARLVQSQYQDGVVWVDLSALGDGAGVVPAVAAAVGLRDTPDRMLVDQVREVFRPREALLILDNCEHVLDACAMLAEALLTSAPSLTILATSREPIGAAGEMLWRVPSLSLPPDPTNDPEANVAESESVRLFSDRAAAVQPGFAVTDENAPAVARICRRLDGIPLAIELAAAGTAARSLEEIAGGIDAALQMLADGRRTAPPRHATLRGAIGWSHDVLTPAEQALFRRLAVFAGGFDRRAIEAVLGGATTAVGDSDEDAPPAELFDRLVRASLVQVELQYEPVRFRLLGPVHQYASERLIAAGDAPALRQHHRDHYVALLEQAHTALRGPEQSRWLEQLDAEHDNIRAALAWSLKNADVDVAVQMIGRLALYWEMHGRFTEGLTWAEQTVAAARGASPLLHARALHSTGNLRRLAGDIAGSIALSEQSLNLFLELGDESRAASVLVNIAGAHWNQGDFQAARRSYEQALDVFRRQDDRLLIAQTLANLGVVANTVADFDRARVLLQESLQRFRQMEDRWSAARVLLAIAAASDLAGDCNAARPLAEESLALYRALDDERGEAWVLARLASISMHQGDGTSAHELYEQSLRLARRVADKRHMVQAMHGLATVTLRRGDTARARSLECESIALGSAIGAHWAIPESLEGLSAVALAEHRPRDAARLLAAAAAARDALAYPHPPADRAAHEAARAAIRMALDEASFAAAWAEGCALTRDQALAEALEGPRDV